MQRAAHPGADVVAARLLADVETYVEGQIANLPGRLEDLLALATDRGRRFATSDPRPIGGAGRLRPRILSTLNPRARRHRLW